MEQHLNFHHPEYVHPGKRLRAPLPSAAAAAVVLTQLEEARLGIPVRPVFVLIAQSESESKTPSAKEKCRNANGATFAVATASSSKRARMK